MIVSGNGHHQQQRHGVALGFPHQQDVDAQHRGTEGQSQVAKHVERDLPLAFAGPIDAQSGGERVRFQALHECQHGVGRRASRPSRRTRTTTRCRFLW